MSTTSRINVFHYGIHWSGDVAFLEQQKAQKIVNISPESVGANALGIPLKTPFAVQCFKRCNHLIALSTPHPDIKHVEIFDRLVQSDPLVRAMLPIPKPANGEGSFFVAPNHKDFPTFLTLLGQMSSPIEPIIRAAWEIGPNFILEELGLTNVQPFVLLGVQPEHTRLLTQVNAMLRVLPRRFICSGNPKTILASNIERIESNTLNDYTLNDLLVLPWAAIGAAVVRKFMRKEWDENAPSIAR